MSRTNYVIIENPIKFHEEIYTEFEKDYIHSDISVKEIMDKYDFNQLDFKRYLQVVKERTGFVRKGGHRHPQYICKVGEGKYRVSKWDGEQKKMINCGTYKKKDAIKVRDKLIEFEWDLSKLSLIKKEVLQ